MFYDAAIIGGGIVGAACADSLSNEGMRVLVIESAKNTSGGTTAAGMGHVVVMDDSDAQFALTNYSRTLWKQLARELPSDNEFEDCGTIWIAADDEEMLEVERKNRFYNEQDVSCQILSSAELYIKEPNLREGLAGGLIVPGDCVVYQLKAASFLFERAEKRGCVIKTGIKAVAVAEGVVYLANGESVKAGRIVIAAGADSSELIKELKITRKKGHLVITDRYPGNISHQLIELGYLKSAHGSADDSVAFNLQPRPTGQILIGSSRQLGEESNEIDYEIVSRMTERAGKYMPSILKMKALRAWTGFRPSTPDNLPYIGRCSGLKNVFAATGHEGLGITTSLGTASLLADEIIARESVIDRTPYSPTRLNRS